MRNITASEEVACTIYPTNQTGDVFGAYVKGSASILTDLAAKKQADNVYYGRVYPDDISGKARNEDGYRLNPNWHFVKISMDELWYFDTRYFGEKRVVVPLGALS